jgi:hypothetical protein
MLYETKDAKQHEGEPLRRCFLGSSVDLFVWYSEDQDILEFQLCYRDFSLEKALTWKRDEGFEHHNVDDGEDNVGGIKRTPMLFPDGHFNKDVVSEIFKKESSKIDPQIASFVLKKLSEYPDS